jgi:hypothetical protein
MPKGMDKPVHHKWIVKSFHDSLQDYTIDNRASDRLHDRE